VASPSWDKVGHASSYLWTGLESREVWGKIIVPRFLRPAARKLLILCKLMEFLFPSRNPRGTGDLSPRRCSDWQHIRLI